MASSTLALPVSVWEAFSYLWLHCSEWTHCKRHLSCGSRGNSWEFKGNFSKVEFHRKRAEGWDIQVTSATPFWRRIFWRTGVDSALSPWPGQNRVSPGAQVPEDWFQRGLVSVGGGDTKSSCLVLTAPEPEFFLEGVQLVQSRLGQPCSCGRERKLLRAGHGSCKRNKWPSRMLFLSSAVRIQPGKIPVPVNSAVAQRGKVTYPGSHSKFEHREESAS